MSTLASDTATRPSPPSAPHPADGRAHGPHLSSRALAAIALGGAAGALTRIAVAQALPGAADRWPWATLIVNLLGCAVLGCILANQRAWPHVLSFRHALLGPGLCGAFTTFSTIQLELLAMIDRHDYGLAATSLTTTVLLGYSAILVSSRVVRRSVSERAAARQQGSLPAQHAPLPAADAVS